MVPIYALGTDADGSPCYAMRFIHGETLQDAIGAFHKAESPGRDRSERSLALRELLTRFISICSTVGDAHSRGILHRDLKPQNVMLGKYDETLVVDWGLAKPISRDDAARSAGEEVLLPSSGSGSGTPTLGVVGTVAYMSPEQAQARWENVGTSSDIFSLGAILYAILAGRAPYQGQSVGEVLKRAERCEFAEPRQLHSRVPHGGSRRSARRRWPGCRRVDTPRRSAWRQTSGGGWQMSRFRHIRSRCLSERGALFAGTRR